MLSLASVAMAIVLTSDHEAIITGWDDEGDPFAQDKFGDPFPINPPRCDGIDVDEDEIVFVFLQSGTQESDVAPNPGGASGNTIDVDLNDGEIFLTDLEADDVQEDSVTWIVGVDPPGDELELVSVSSNVDGGELVVEAICFAAAPDTSTLAAPSAERGTSGWLLLVALGVLVLSVLVVGPVRTSRRR